MTDSQDSMALTADAAPPGNPMRPRTWRAILDLVLLGVAAHSIVVGVSLLFLPLWVLQLVGWGYDGQAFWVSQAGLFLLVLGAAYASAIRVRALVWLVIGSKAGAVVFLLVSAVWLGAPQIVVLLAFGDGLMGLAVGLSFWQLTRAEISE